MKRKRNLRKFLSFITLVGNFEQFVRDEEDGVAVEADGLEADHVGAAGDVVVPNARVGDQISNRNSVISVHLRKRVAYVIFKKDLQHFLFQSKIPKHGNITS